MGRAWTISSNAPSDSITLSSGYSIRIGSPFSYISSKLESILALCCWIYSTAHLISSDKISSFYISINKKKLDVLHDRQRDAVPQEARKRSFPRTFGPSSLPRRWKYVLHDVGSMCRMSFFEIEFVIPNKILRFYSFDKYIIDVFF